VVGTRGRLQSPHEFSMVISTSVLNTPDVLRYLCLKWRERFHWAADRTLVEFCLVPTAT